MIFSESDQNIVKRVIERAAEIPFTEELFANVGIWKIRFVKRRRFATRLYLSLVHLSLRSMSEVFIERSQALRDCASSHFTEQWQRDYLTQLADLSPGYFFPGQSPLTSLAMWTLNTRHISNGVLYLASGLDKIYETFRTEDTACLRRENDEAEFAKLMQLERSSTVTIETHVAETYAARAAQLVRDARTYRSLAIWDADPKCEWRCSFVPPERCHVTQAGAGDFDEWITIGSDHYWNLGFWIGPMTAETAREGTGDAFRRREKLNTFLRIDIVSTILSQFRIAEASRYEEQELHYAVLAYNVSQVAQIPEIKTWLGEELDGSQLDVEIWLDLSSGFPVKTRLKARELDWRQVFVGFNEAFEIEAPANSSAMEGR